MRITYLAAATRWLLRLSLAGGLCLAGCTNKGPAGGPLDGMIDMHCTADDGGQIAQQIDLSKCGYLPPDAEPSAPDAALVPDYLPNHYNAVADTDDCKYHLEWTSTPIYENTDVYFTVKVSTLVDGKPATGANPYLEVYLNEHHPAPTTNQKSVEGPPGTYKSGPIRFDAPGNWTVRFHEHYNCADLIDTSPHDHAAFFVHVP